MPEDSKIDRSAAKSAPDLISLKTAINAKFPGTDDGAVARYLGVSTGYLRKVLRGSLPVTKTLMQKVVEAVEGKNPIIKKILPAVVPIKHGQFMKVPDALQEISHLDTVLLAELVAFRTGLPVDTVAKVFEALLAVRTLKGVITTPDKQGA